MRAAEVALAAAALLGVGAALFAAPAHRAPADTPEHEVLHPDTASRDRAEWDLDSLAREVVTADPFRAARTAPTVRYGTVREVDGSEGTPHTPAEDGPSALVLSGIILGARPAAVLEGLPGMSEAQVVSVGDTVAGFVVRLIERDSVVVVGADTTLILTVNEVWR